MSRAEAKDFYKKRIESVVKLQGWFRASLARKRYMEDLRALLLETGDENLLLTNDEIKRKIAAKVILKHIHKFW